MTDDEPTEPDDGEVDDGAPSPAPEFPRQKAIAALVANIAVVLFCSPLFGLVGVAVAVIGLTRVSSNPASAAVFVRWAWIIFGVAIVLFTILNVWAAVTAPDEDASLTVLAAARYG
jgi:hypothetical protein